MNAPRITVFVMFQAAPNVITPWRSTCHTATTEVSRRNTKVNTCGMMKLNGDAAAVVEPVTCHFCSRRVTALMSALT